ncbi:MAG TPA: PrgI family protein [Candidatus Bathyarchaeia archaeon]|nr:PrgI family protein [Candidatus Bathyarchaeia archaeon]
MAVYKVPQDVEADDKLIGPFSFRQFIYLIIVAIAMAMAWGLSQIFIPLVIIPLPVIVFFAALALPLRKDQPMEAYLSAVVSFYFLKSRKRYWIPDGIDSFVTIIPPKDADKILTKDLDQSEATKRLGYLADLVDTHGWAIRGAGAAPDTSVSTDLYYESQQTVDMMDNTTPAAQAMTKHLTDAAQDKREQAVAGMHTAAKQLPTPANTATAAPAAAPAPTAPPAATPAPAPQSGPSATVAADTPLVLTLPSIAEIKARQDALIQKATDQKSRDAIAYANALIEEARDGGGKTQSNTSVSTPDTDTMELTQKQADELSHQKDVSVETLAKQADRVAKQNKVLKNGDEVTISFH